MNRTLQLGLALLISVGICVAQGGGGGRGGRGGGGRGGGGGGFGGGFGGGGGGSTILTEGRQPVNIDTTRTARETLPMVTDFADWTNAPGFEKDVFTYVRAYFQKGGAGGSGERSGSGWINDYPDSDLNLSYRLQQLTSIRTDPDGRILRLTDPKLTEYPMIFMSQPSGMYLRDDENLALRQYLQNGGVLWADDIWGDNGWDGFVPAIQRVLPDHNWTELTIEHPIFHSVFDFKGPVNNLQVPSMRWWTQNRSADPSTYRVSRQRGTGNQDVHIRAWLDNKQRIMVIAMHNMDLGDGFEREGQEEAYFKQFSETRAYPFAINVIFYLMTH